MKKSLLSLLIVLLFYSANSQSKKKNSLQEWNLKGSIKSVSETSYKAVKKSDAIQKGKRKREGPDYEMDFRIVFNDKGNQAEKTLYNTDGSIFKKITYRYDEKGTVIGETSTKPDGSTSAENNFICVYDSN